MRPVPASLASLRRLSRRLFRRLLHRLPVRPGAVLVSGESMRPTLRPGDALLVGYGVRPRPGMLVVARLPDRPLGIKRAVVHVPGEGWWLDSDNPRAGTGSATFGAVPERDIVGVALARYWPQPRLLWPGRHRQKAAREP